MTVYFLQAGTDGPIKIGYCGSDLDRRIEAIQCGCPWKLSLLGCVSGTRGNELWLHRRFVADRLRGEWFEPTSGLLHAISDILSTEFSWPEPDFDGVVPRGVRHPSGTTTPTGEIIKSVGGVTKVSMFLTSHMKRKIGVATVSAWSVRNRIPDIYRPALVEMAAQERVEGITYESFVRSHLATPHAD